MPHRNPEDYSDIKTSQQGVEAAIIGHIYLRPDQSSDIFELIQNPEVFTSWTNRQVFTACQSIVAEGRMINAQTILKYFEDHHGKAPSDLMGYLIKCSEVADADVWTDQAIKGHINVLMENFYMRRFRDASKRCISMEGVHHLAKEILEWDYKGHTTTRPPAQIVDSIIARQRAIYDGRVEAGYSWGISRLDQSLLLRPGHLYTVGGLKKGGKTLFLLSSVAHNLVDIPNGGDPVPTLFFSIEMSDEELFKRLISKKSRINSKIIHTKYLTNEQFDAILSASEAFRDIPLVVDDDPNLSLVDIIVRARSWKYKQQIPDGTGIIAVDFMQLIRMEPTKRGETTAELIKSVAYGLARLAKELKVAIIALAQLRNEAEGQEPHLRFLEGSGAIAQASEAVILVDLVKRRDKEHISAYPGYDTFRVIVEAQRSGESGEVVLTFADLSLAEFREFISDPFDA